MITESDSHEKDVKASSDETKDTSNPNGSRHSAEIDTKKGDQTKADHHHHHHKRSRGKNYDTSSDDKKIREKKKRKKSREHEKKKSKKDRKTRPEKEKAKKPSSKAESIEKTSEGEFTGTKEAHEASPQEIMKDSGEFNVDQTVNEANLNTTLPQKVLIDTKSSFRRSDSVLDINPNIDLEIDEWPSIDPPEMSKWEREENKSATSVENCDAEVSNGEAKKGSEEKVTSEILKRAENAIFARAISAIRPVEGKGKSKVSEISSDAGSKKDSSPTTSTNKRTETAKDSKIQAFQVTVPANESGSRSVELKSIEGARESNKSRKSPMRPSIKNRLGVKVVDRRSRTKSLSRSPKRRLQSDCTKVVRSSRDGAVRSHAERSSGSGRDRHPSSENRRNYKPLSSCIKITHDRETRDSNTNSSRSRVNDRRRSHSPEDKRNAPKRHRSRTRSHSRNNARRSNPKSKDDKNLGTRTKEQSSRVEEKSSKAPEQSLIDTEKAKVKSSRQDVDPLAQKRSRDSSSSSASSTSSQNSQKHSKRHAKQKSKKKSRSLSADSNGTSKRKKSKKDKKTKKKKKSSRK